MSESSAGREHRVGQGWDRHRLEPQRPSGAGRPLIVGGVLLESSYGPVAHSDGDALAHALVDALFGAAGLGDIGQHFPDTDPANRDLDSMTILERAAGLVREAGWDVINADLTVHLQRPRLGEARPRIRERVAGALGVDAGVVNVKAKTGEGIGVVGRGEAIEAAAIVLLERSAS